MNSVPTRNLIEPFEKIDELVCGTGFASETVVARTRAFQSALKPDRPLCRMIADSLLDIPGAQVAVFTGFVVPGKYPVGENDGPLGAAALARALLNAGLRPTIHVDPEVLETTRWLLAELSADVGVVSIGSSSTVLPVSIDVAIAIEKPGANSAGAMHTADGARIAGGSKPVDRLFLDLHHAGTMTLGIGDQGNEIGFGTLGEALGKINPRTQTCTCGCGCGIAAATPTRYLYPAAVSNWGAYGLTAALALLLGDGSATLRPEEEKRMLHVAAVHGCCDGVHRRGMYGIDGIAGDVSVRLVGALHDHVHEENARGSKKTPVRDTNESGHEALRE